MSEQSLAPGVQSPTPELFVLVGPDALRVGSCEQCVWFESGRPERAWSAAGDRELDFDRDTLLAKLAELGVVVVAREEFVCP